MFISHKRRRSNENRFGFVRFEKIEEAHNAARNLNGIKVRGQVLKVSFSKYDRNCRLCPSQLIHEQDKVVEAKGN